MSKKYVQTNNFYLAGSGVVIGATSIVLTSFTDIYGNVLTMSDFGSLGHITLEPDSTNEESATFSGVTANANGTYTLTGVKTALAKYPYTETSGLVRSHSGGTKVVVSDTTTFWNTFGNKENANTWDDVQTFSVPAVQATQPTASSQVANKAYVDGVAIAGAAKATDSVYGIAKLSTAAVSATDPIVVGTNDTRVPTQDENDALVGTSGTAVSSANKLVDNSDTATTATANKVARRLAGGNITIVTESASNNSTNAASTAYVDNQISVSGVTVFKNGETTKNAADASTTQAIAHGLGKPPKKVRIKLYLPNNSNASPYPPLYAEAVYNGTTQVSNSLYTLYNGSTVVYPIDNTFSLNSSTSGASAPHYTRGVITFDSTNINIAWTKTSSPTGTYTLIWEAEG